MSEAHPVVVVPLGDGDAPTGMIFVWGCSAARGVGREDGVFIQTMHIVGIGSAPSYDEAYARTRRLLMRRCPPDEAWMAHIVTIERKPEMEAHIIIADRPWDGPDANIRFHDLRSDS